MLGKLFLLFTIVPAVELYLLIKIGSLIGPFTTLMIIIITGAAGASLAKFEGRKSIYKIQKSLESGKLPGNEMVSGIMIFIGGVLLLTPGFLTDIIGLTFLIPGTRNLWKIVLIDIFNKKIKNQTAYVYTSNTTSQENVSINSDENVVDAEYEEIRK